MENVKEAKKRIAEKAEWYKKQALKFGKDSDQYNYDLCTSNGLFLALGILMAETNE